MDSIEDLEKRWREIYRVLSASTRRQVVGSLLEVPPDTELSLPEAANLPDNRLDTETLHANLVHTHLPMMAEPGFVEWGEEPFQVERGPNFEDVAAVILAIDDDDEFPQHLIEGCHFYEMNRVTQ